MFPRATDVLNERNVFFGQHAFWADYDTLDGVAVCESLRIQCVVDAFDWSGRLEHRGLDRSCGEQTDAADVAILLLWRVHFGTDSVIRVALPYDVVGEIANLPQR